MTVRSLFERSEPLTGNTAKVKVLCELYRRFAGREGLTVLDIGCVGPQPLYFWRPLLSDPRLNFQLVGIDVDEQGIEKARAVVRELGVEERVTLMPGNGYHLDRLFGPASFDIVVATQVLEHVARPSRFMEQVSFVLKSGGEGFFTLDSAHYEPRFSLRKPLRLAKNLVKKVLAWFGNERHYDLPWFDHEVIRAAREARLEPVEVRYYNLGSLKPIHNHHTPDEVKNEVMWLWFSLEEVLNERGIASQVKGAFRGIYLHVRK